MLVRFDSVEELEEVVQALGWQIEYRQMGRGEFRADLACLQSDGIIITDARYNNHLQIPSESPEGYIGFVFKRQGVAEAFGKPIGDGELVVSPPRSEIEYVTRGEIRTDSLLMPEAEFQTAARSIAPSASVYSRLSAAIQVGNPQLTTAIQQDFDAAHQKGDLDPETASKILAATILWMAEASSQGTHDRLVNGATAAMARRAQTWIETNLNDVIRMQDVCAFTGVGLRTLQRCFASYFQISPLNYIKARRLNNVRRDLKAADPSGRSVSMIAMDNGFFHLGRFSVEYRSHFGEAPRETLARK